MLMIFNLMCVAFISPPLPTRQYAIFCVFFLVINIFVHSHSKYRQTEPPIPTTHCSRLYGIFADENKCDVFWNCWNGEASRYQCSPGLAYDREARVCMWADQVPECRNEGKFNFTILHLYRHYSSNLFVFFLLFFLSTRKSLSVGLPSQHFMHF